MSDQGQTEKKLRTLQKTPLIDCIEEMDLATQTHCLADGQFRWIYGRGGVVKVGHTPKYTLTLYTGYTLLYDQKCLCSNWSRLPLSMKEKEEKKKKIRGHTSHCTTSDLQISLNEHPYLTSSLEANFSNRVPNLA